LPLNAGRHRAYKKAEANAKELFHAGAV
jgi:hypothetical protein